MNQGAHIESLLRFCSWKKKKTKISRSKALVNRTKEGAIKGCSWKKVFFFASWCWHSLSVLENQLNLPHLIPQSAIFGFIDISNEDYLIANYLLLLLKYFIYNAKNRKHLTFETYMKNITNFYMILRKTYLTRILIRKQNTLKLTNCWVCYQVM